MTADDDALLAALSGKAGGTLVDQVDKALEVAWRLSSGLNLTLPQSGSTPGPYRAGGSSWDLAVDQATARWGTAPKARTLAEKVALLEALVRGIDKAKAGAGGEAVPSPAPSKPAQPSSWPPAGAAWSASWDGSDPRDGGKFKSAPWNYQSASPTVRQGRLRVEFLPNGAQAPAKGASASDYARRCELEANLPESVTPKAGRTVWHRFDLTLVNFPVDTSSWNVMPCQWKGDGQGSPPLAVEVNKGQWTLVGINASGKRVYRHVFGTAKQGVATTLTIGVTFGTTGHLTAYQDGVKTLDVDAATMHPGKGSYWKSVGIYADKALSGPLCLEVDRMAAGPTLASVT